MSASQQASLAHRWFPVCASQDVPVGHIFEAELLGQELAVWRGSAGTVNVWENRCPHRGMRLTVGSALGAELRCAYHGYRFADGSGQCQSVPAQLDRSPPRSLCVKTYRTFERGGLIWTRLREDDPTDTVAPELDFPTTVLYSVVIRADAVALSEHLALYRFRPSAALVGPESADESCVTSIIDAYSYRSVATNQEMTSEVRLFTQPVDAHSTGVHGILLGVLDQAQRLQTLRHHAELLTDLRDTIERRVPGTLVLITLYDYELSGNCYKVRLFLALLGVPYSRHAIDFYPGREHKSPCSSS